MRKIVWSGLVLALVSSVVHAQEGPQGPSAGVARPLESALTTSAATAAAADKAAASQDPAAKQDSATLDFFRKIEISGFVDTYYTYNFNRPAHPCATVGGVAISNCLYNFNVAHNSLSLNLAEVALEKKPTQDSRAGFRVDLDYGPSASVVNAFEPGGSTYQNIQQAYVSFLAPAGTGLQLDFGKFVTMMGNEVIESKDNWNYGRSLLFALAIPYYHTGARLTYAPTAKVTLQAHVVNGWNNAQDNNTGKSVGAAVTLKPTGALTIIENVMFGPEQNDNNDDWRKMSDTIVTYAATKQLTLAANYDHGQDRVNGASVMWHGVAAYAKYQATDWFALSPRVEWYRDRDGFTTGTDQTLKEATLTAEFKHKDGLIMRLEYRGDFSDSTFFTREISEPVKNQNTFTVGVVYAFSTKAQ